MSIETTGGRKSIDPAPRSKPEPDTDALQPGLYIVATPIGNMDDITLRALRVLKRADIVACEDTRVSAKLLAHYGITTRRVSYRDQVAARMGEKLLERIAAGAAVALVSDAGTPLVADPGFPLVREALARDMRVTVVPGPSAPLTALLLSGLPSERFLHAGFLPPKASARRRVLAELASVPATLIFLETAPRLAGALADMASELGDRPAAVARELTKLYEEVRRDRLAALAAHYAQSGPPRGEIVVVVGPPDAPAPATDTVALDAALESALETMSVKDASAHIAAATGLKRRDVYARALALAGRRA